MKKLIRDKIPEIMVINNQYAKTKVLNDNEYILALGDKLLEEAQEFIEASKRKESMLKQQSEIADILEVIEAICKVKNYDNQSIQQIKQRKKLERGGFEKRLLLID